MFSLERDSHTICAVATAPGRGGIAVIRVSGEQAQAIVRKSCEFLPSDPITHSVYYGFLKDPTSQQHIDEVLVSYFQQGRSFTNEETIEISCHGGSVVCQNILAVLIDSGARLADPGEFSYRAFSNGRIDLIQAESVLQLIESESQKAARLSLRQLQGDVSSKIYDIEQGLIEILAQLEANIDFSSEDIVIEDSKTLATKSEQVLEIISNLLGTYKKGRIINEGLKVALVGQPNVGKSSILNALLGEERAIVTDVAGTTRDKIEEQIVLGSSVIRLVDTAGLRLTEDKIESLGIEKTIDVISKADLGVFIVDSSLPQLPDLNLLKDLQLEKVALVANKLDLVKDEKHLMSQLESLTEQIAQTLPSDSKIDLFVLSAHSESSILPFRKYLQTLAGGEFSENSAIISQARHFDLLTACEARVSAATDLLLKDESPDMIALDLQQALQKVFEVSGKQFDDEVLDQVFRQFCLGK